MRAWSFHGKRAIYEINYYIIIITPWKVNLGPDLDDETGQHGKPPVKIFATVTPEYYGGFPSMFSKIRLAVRWAYNCGAL